MAWPLDQQQASWVQNEIYGSPLADASDLVSLFLPDIQPAGATNYRAYRTPSTNDVQHLEQGHQLYRAGPASVPFTWAAIAGEDIPTTITKTTNNPHSAINKPPAEPASSHHEPKPRTRKKTSRATDSYVDPRPATTLECKWEGCHYPGSFNREHELLRHLRTIHIAPLTHPCPVEGCNKVCNREDNLLQHMKKRHRSW